MTFVEWLSSPIGIDLVHAVIVLLLATASWLSFQTHRIANENAAMIERHLEHHPALVEPPPAAHPTSPFSG